MLNIAIIDDEIGILEVLKEFIQHEYPEINVYTFDHPEKFYEIASQVKFDLVFLDIRFGKEENLGIKVLKTIKNKNPDIQVVIMTAYPNLETAIQSIEFNALGYLKKPIDLNVIKEYIDKVKSYKKVISLININTINLDYILEKEENLPMALFAFLASLREYITIEDLVIKIFDFIQKITKNSVLSLIIHWENINYMFLYGIKKQKFSIIKKKIDEVIDTWSKNSNDNSIKDVLKEKIFLESPIYVGDLSSDKIHNINIPLITPNNNGALGYLVVFSGKPIASKHKDILFMIGELITPIILNALLYKKLQIISLTDPLTKIYNHTAILNILERELERLERYNGAIAVAMIDIDNFKKLNDTYGHLFGDQVLIEVANTLKASIRKTDHVGRYGGEEFLVILYGKKNSFTRDVAHKVLERLRENVANLKFYTFHQVKVTISVGYTFIDNKTKTNNISQIIKTADKALYEAKNTGKNKVIYYKFS